MALKSKISQQCCFSHNVFSFPVPFFSALAPQLNPTTLLEPRCLRLEAHQKHNELVADGQRTRSGEDPTVSTLAEPLGRDK